MLFNSFTFAIFLPIVFLLYWFVFNRNLRLQNLFIVVASYIFYSWWDWRFLFLITFISLCSFSAGLLMQHISNKEVGSSSWIKPKTVSIANIVVNLCVLGIFKYYHFFVDNFVAAFASVGIHLQPTTLQIILPVGISFYTFHALSYSIDVYKKRVPATKDIIGFFAFIGFFPLLVAGPIERATHLLPQMFRKRTFDNNLAVDGLRQILWGLFKKMVVADNCASVVNEIFSNHTNYSGSTLVIGMIFFAFQLYCDFSGYSDIAIGVGKLFGFNLLRNFDYPYFATSFAEYWRRNHISMTQWFMDYVYYPLIGDSTKLWYWNFCMIITFLLSGLWHGSGWTFIVWGLYQGVFIVISMNTQKSRKRVEKKYHLKDSRIYAIFRMILTFSIVCVGLIFFRAKSIAQAWSYFGGIFTSSFFSTPHIKDVTLKTLVFTIIFIVMFMTIEWRNREKQHGLQVDNTKSPVVRWALYFALIAIIWAFEGQKEQFIYFQF